MWDADPAFWGRTAPVLFPIVGALKDNSYRYEGQTYLMGQHGFARDMDFTLTDQTEDSKHRIFAESAYSEKISGRIYYWLQSDK